MPPHPRTPDRAAAADIGGGRGGCRRVGHAIIKAGADLDALAGDLAGARWDMVELDVLMLGDELVVAHDAADLAHPRPLRFADALAALKELLPETVEIDVDLKATGYEAAVLATLRSLALIDRTLVSSMERSSLRALRATAPELRLGLSVPKVRRNYLAHPVTRPGAHLGLAYLRRMLPRQATAVLGGGLADAIMAHWGVVTPHLAAAVRAARGELYVWTVDDPSRLVAVDRIGVTGVITNDRELFARAGL
ncbi:MAG: glycerophosphodiester phosphodiesterase [Solirubrobacteraceae bacterium]